MTKQGYHTILFDIDGVMLSEERYFDGSALTVYELLCSPRYAQLKHPDLPAFRTEFEDSEIAHIRAVTFVQDQAFETIKTRGINANWDMVYLQVAFHLADVLRALQQAGAMDRLATISEAVVADGWSPSTLALIGQELRISGVPYTLDFASFDAVMQSGTTKADLLAIVERRLAEATAATCPPFETNRGLWLVCQQTFQEWYLGDDYVVQTRQPGKPGFLADEVAVVDPTALTGLFRDLIASGVTIGIATGRPELETTIPLQSFGWLEWFDIRRISTASDVLNAEQAVPSAAPLAKPNPYSYLRSLLAEADPAVILSHPLPVTPEIGHSTLVVGDSIADLLAARALGCTFAAVLTGLEGERARAQFEARGADYIARDVLELRQILSL